MNIIEKPETTTDNAPTNRKVKAKTATKENPIRVFEMYAKQIWVSDSSDAEKAARLRSLAKSIDDYLVKLDAHIGSSNVDSWTELSINRLKTYLAQLADDVRKLAMQSPGEFSRRILGQYEG